MKHLEKNGKVVLNRFNGFEDLNPPDRDLKVGDLFGVVLDVETTDLKPENGDLIQVSLLPFYFDGKTGEVTAISKPITRLQQPNKPLSDITKEITGFQNKDLEGQSIDWKKLKKILAKAKVVIAHNAKFDYKWIDKYITMPKVAWCCSMADVDWSDICRASVSLEVLAAWSGFYYGSHKADMDVMVTFHMLRETNKLANLILDGMKDSVRLYAVNTPYDRKDELKRRNYKWDRSGKCWYIDCLDSDQISTETSWLKANFDEIRIEKVNIKPYERML